MTSLAALTAAALLAGLPVAQASPSPRRQAEPASSAGALPAAQGPVTFEASRVVYDGTTGTYLLEGDAVVRRGSVVLRSRSAKVDAGTGEVWASGGVLLVDATRVVQAETLHAVLDGPFEASEVVAFLKDQPLDPVKVASLAEARRGRNRLTLAADRVEGDAAGALRVRGPRLTLCDCGEGKAPTWELSAPRAEVKGDRLSLSWPVLRVTPRFVGVRRPVPVLVVPWLSLPLRERQSGLLFPVLGTHSITGVGVGLPIYFTLGRSADATVTPEWFFGPSDPHRTGGAVAGPGLGLELRWAPAERARGQVRLHLVDDRDLEHLESGERGAAGLRLSIEGEHHQDLGPSARLVAELHLAQDAFFFRDFRGEGLPADAFYSRSGALVSHREERWVLEGGATYLEPLVHGDEVGPGKPTWFGAGLPVLQRWPSAAAILLPSSLGGLQLQGRVGVSRWAPLSGDAGHSGPLLRTDPGFGRPLPEGVVALPREAVTRGEARLQLSWPTLLGRGLSAEPWVRGAVSGYAFDAVDPTAAAWGVGGLSLSSELARRFGSVEHRILPRLELLGGTAVWRPARAGAFPAYDLWDRTEPERAGTSGGAPAVIVQPLSAAPSGAYAQARLVLGNRLAGLGGSGGSLQLDLGQDLDLRRGALAESFVALAVARGPFTADADVRFLAFGGRPSLLPWRALGWKPSWLDDFTRLHAGAALRDARGDAIHVSLDAAGAGAVGRQNAGVDVLFDLRSSGVAPDAWWRAGAQVALGGASLAYDVKLTARDYPNVQCGSGTIREAGLGAGRPFEQTGALVWDSPCHCFTVRVRASRDACDNMTYGLDVDLSKMLQGAAASRR